MQALILAHVEVTKGTIRYGDCGFSDNADIKLLARHSRNQYKNKSPQLQIAASIDLPKIKGILP